tara:strand:+ start:3771 stop:5450 length:1680 start_codon:yes stop_codon:yes gene_type:complete
MAASTNTNQINIGGVDGDGENSISSAEVVLLKDESLTLADNSAVDYSNYGNYKALKVTDDSSNTQYIVSLKGHLDTIDLAVRNSSGTYVSYPLYQHSLEYSQSNTPLADISDEAGIEDRNNSMFIYGTNLGGTQSKTQRFNDTYQIEISDKWTDQGKYDLLKGLKVGDTVDVTIFQNQGVRNKRTETVTNDGRLAELSGNSDIYMYYIKEVTTPTDERVDSNKHYRNAAQWSARPGISKLLVDTVSSNNKTSFNIFIDAQGFRTGDYELGYDANNYADDLGGFGFCFYDNNGQELSSEYLLLQPNTAGYDKAGRFLGTYVTDYEAESSDFPVYIEVFQIFASTLGEYYYDGPHYWSEWDAGYGSIDATNPDIMTGELVDDPWCFDRQYTDNCDLQLDTNHNPWYSYRFLSDSSATGGGGSATTNTTKMYNDSIINKKIQFQSSVTEQFNLLVKGDGIRNIYKYRTKKYQTSTQDRPSMLRTVSMTYTSYNPITIRIITENGENSKNIVFDRTTNLNELAKKLTTTKVVGLRCKSFELEITVYGVIDDILEINKLSVSYG